MKFEIIHTILPCHPPNKLLMGNIYVFLHTNTHIQELNIYKVLMREIKYTLNKCHNISGLWSQSHYCQDVISFHNDL